MTGVRTTILDVPIRRAHAFAHHSIDRQSYLIVEVDTDAGITGLGEGVSPGGPWWGGESIEGQKQIIDHYIAPVLRGRRAEDFSSSREAIDRAVYGNPFAKSAVEMALLDAVGQHRNVPLSLLLGGSARDTLPVRWALSGSGDSETVEDATARLDEGHRALKFKMGVLPAEDDVRRVAWLVEKIGADVDYLGDPNGVWDLRTATWAVKELEAIGVNVIEQPTPRDDPRALAEVRRQATRIKVMADESVCQLTDALAAIGQRLCDSVAVKPGKSGGLRAAALMEAVLRPSGIACYGGTALEGPIGTAASAHLFASFTHLPLGCELVGPLLLADDITTGGIQYVNGELCVPAGPGLGVKLDPDKVARYRRPKQD